MIFTQNMTLQEMIFTPNMTLQEMIFTQNMTLQEINLHKMMANGKIMTENLFHLYQNLFLNA